MRYNNLLIVHLAIFVMFASFTFADNVSENKIYDNKYDLKTDSSSDISLNGKYKHFYLYISGGAPAIYNWGFKSQLKRDIFINAEFPLRNIPLMINYIGEGMFSIDVGFNSTNYIKKRIYLDGEIGVTTGKAKAFWSYENISYFGAVFKSEIGIKYGPTVFIKAAPVYCIEWDQIKPIIAIGFGTRF